MQRTPVIRFLTTAITAIVAFTAPWASADSALPSPAALKRFNTAGEHAPPTDQLYYAQAVDSILRDLLGDDFSAAIGFTPRVRVIPLDEVNAYAMPPHTVILTEGLLAKFHARDQLAYVIAHEIGHLASHKESKVAALNGASHSHENLEEELNADRRARKMLQYGKFSIDGAEQVLVSLLESQQVGVGATQLRHRLEVIRKMRP